MVFFILPIHLNWNLVWRSPWFNSALRRHLPARNYSTRCQPAQMLTELNLFRSIRGTARSRRQVAKRRIRRRCTHRRSSPRNRSMPLAVPSSPPPADPASTCPHSYPPSRSVARNVGNARMPSSQYPLGLVAVLQESRQLQAAVPRQHRAVIWLEHVHAPPWIPLRIAERRAILCVDRVDIVRLATEGLGVHVLADGDGHWSSSGRIACAQ